MTDIVRITSKDNLQLRYAMTLHDRKTAESQGVVFLEGVRLCEDALYSGISPLSIYFNTSKETLVAAWCERFSYSSQTKLFHLPDPLFAKLSSTKNPQGVAIIAKSPLIRNDIPIRGNDLYLVCEETSDPGNLGTMIRMADAFDFTAVIVISGCVDPFNEKVLRASMGSCFHIPIVSFPDIDSAIFQLQKIGVQLVASHLDGQDISKYEYTFPVALFIGNEARGLSEECAKQCDVLAKIEMPGKAESLNASSAASIFGYVLNQYRNK